MATIAIDPSYINKNIDEWVREYASKEVRNMHLEFNRDDFIVMKFECIMTTKSLKAFGEAISKHCDDFHKELNKKLGKHDEKGMRFPKDNIS